MHTWIEESAGREKERTEKELLKGDMHKKGTWKGRESVVVGGEIVCTDDRGSGHSENMGNNIFPFLTFSFGSHLLVFPTPLFFRVVRRKGKNFD